MKPEIAAPVSWDVTRILLAVVAIGGLLAATFWVLRPFLPALIWAAMIVVATWPVMQAVQSVGGRWRRPRRHRGTLGATTMTTIAAVNRRAFDEGRHDGDAA